MFDTLWWSLYVAKEFNFVITDSDLPPNSPLRLNTTSFEGTRELPYFTPPRKKNFTHLSICLSCRRHPSSVQSVSKSTYGIGSECTTMAPNCHLGIWWFVSRDEHMIFATERRLIYCVCRTWCCIYVANGCGRSCQQHTCNSICYATSNHCEHRCKLLSFFLIGHWYANMFNNSYPLMALKWLAMCCLCKSNYLFRYKG
jgi:hypothetical protein